MQLDKNQLKEAQELLSKLDHIYSEKAANEALKKAREEKLKFEVAHACDLKNKAGEILSNKVKMPLLLSLINELYREKANKKAEDYELMEQYRLALKRSEISKDIVQGYINALDEVESSSKAIKEAFLDVTLLDKDVIDAINIIAKERYKEVKEDKMLEAGFDVKPAKDKTEILELKSELENILK